MSNEELLKRSLGSIPNSAFASAPEALEGLIPNCLNYPPSANRHPLPLCTSKAFIISQVSGPPFGEPSRNGQPVGDRFQGRDGVGSKVLIASFHVLIQETADLL
jgi:hypothetical protein